MGEEPTTAIETAAASGYNVFGSAVADARCDNHVVELRKAMAVAAWSGNLPGDWAEGRAGLWNCAGDWVGDCAGGNTSYLAGDWAMEEWQQISTLQEQVPHTDGMLDTPGLGSQQLPSVGSAVHLLGSCRPCAFVHTKGCVNGVNCNFCHICPKREKRDRKKAVQQHRYEAVQDAVRATPRFTVNREAGDIALELAITSAHEACEIGVHACIRHATDIPVPGLDSSDEDLACDTPVPGLDSSDEDLA